MGLNEYAVSIRRDCHYLEPVNDQTAYEFRRQNSARYNVEKQIDYSNLKEMVKINERKHLLQQYITDITHILNKNLNICTCYTNDTNM